MENNSFENRFQNAGHQENYSPQDNLLQIVLRHRWIILGTVLLFLFTAVFYLVKATPIYTSSSRLVIEQSGPRLISEFDGIISRSMNYLYTQAELMKSSPILTEVANDPEIKGLKTFEKIDNMAGYLKNQLSIDIGKKDDIITVSFDSAYPEEAALIVNKAVNSYVDYQSLHTRSAVSEVQRILQNEKVKRDEELEAKFAELLKFTRENGVVSFDGKGGNVVYQKLSKIADALTESQLASINAKADLGAVRSMADDPAKVRQFAISQPGSFTTMLKEEVNSDLKSELRNAEVKLKNMGYYVTNEHPSMKALRARIEYLKNELFEDGKKFADIYTEVMELRWATAKQRENELQVSFDIVKLEAREAGVKAAEYMVLQSELKRTENICDILDNRIKELNVSEESGALNISILEVARAAVSPSKPQKAKILAMALMLGFMVGGGLAIGRDWMDYRLRSVDEIAAVLGVSVLGTVPAMEDGETITGRGQKAWCALKSRVSDIYQEFGAGREAFKTVSSAVEKMDEQKKHNCKIHGQKVHLEPRSVFAEAYRTIRTAIFFGAPKTRAKTILITSPASGDGKSTLTSNLAITMAQAGQKTLLIDADFRRPTQHYIFDTEIKKGVATILAGMDTLEEAIQKSDIEGLDILCHSPEVPNPADILNSIAFKELLEQLCERYDRIVIDAPPVGPVADGRILAAICDMVIMVLRAEKSTRRHSRDACESILSVGGRLLGVVVNNVSRKQGYYGRHYGYGYGYSSYSNHSYYGEKVKA
ncbi:MAG: polysaccharide biosynthesis tyrosine autokinase [Phycisphaerae bacterium]|nr:polysaccharide biosynthesis tyrosine autokinase [Phycisphaerae bacterium]